MLGHDQNSLAQGDLPTELGSNQGGQKDEGLANVAHVTQNITPFAHWQTSKDNDKWFMYACMPG